MDNEMIERCVIALEEKFKTIIEFNSGQSFIETKVSLPNRNVWQEYALTVIKAMREPTEKMLKAADYVDSIVKAWEAMIDCIIGVE